MDVWIIVAVAIALMIIAEAIIIIPDKLPVIRQLRKRVKK